MPKGSWREFEDLPLKENPRISEMLPVKADRAVKVQRTRGGKGGKTVTIIRGLGLKQLDAKNLLKKLKIRCGTGGTLKSEYIELQGDQVQTSIEFLKTEGFNPKKSGG